MEVYLLVITICTSGICDTYVDDWGLTWDDCVESVYYWDGEGKASCVYDGVVDPYQEDE